MYLPVIEGMGTGVGFTPGVVEVGATGVEEPGVAADAVWKSAKSSSSWLEDGGA